MTLLITFRPFYVSFSEYNHHIFSQLLPLCDVSYFELHGMFESASELAEAIACSEGSPSALSLTLGDRVDFLRKAVASAASQVSLLEQQMSAGSGGGGGYSGARERLSFLQGALDLAGE